MFPPAEVQLQVGIVQPIRIAYLYHCWDLGTKIARNLCQQPPRLNMTDTQANQSTMEFSRPCLAMTSCGRRYAIQIEPAKLRHGYGTQFTAFIFNLKLFPLPDWNVEKSLIRSWNEMQSRMAVTCGRAHSQVLWLHANTNLALVPPSESICTQKSQKCHFWMKRLIASQSSNMAWEIPEKIIGASSRRKCSAILDAKVIKTSDAYAGASPSEADMYVLYCIVFVFVFVLYCIVCLFVCLYIYIYIYLYI